MPHRFARTAPLLLLCGFLAACATKPQAPLPSSPGALAPREPAPDTVTGLSANALRAGFGAPAFIRKDGIAEIWRYDGAACHAFFFLYDEQGIQVVRHFEILPQGPGADANGAACLNALRVKSS